MADVTRTPGVLAAINRAMRQAGLGDAVIADPTYTFTQAGSTAVANVPIYYVTPLTGTGSTVDIIVAIQALVAEVNFNRGAINRLVDTFQTYGMVRST